jgi:hypothetical protein
VRDWHDPAPKFRETIANVEESPRIMALRSPSWERAKPKPLLRPLEFGYDTVLHRYSR